MSSVIPDRSYTIHEVAQLTGLTEARLRVWERRYAVVRPRRQANRYRAYSTEQAALLRALARLCAAGARIGDLMREPRETVIARAAGQATDGSPLGQLLEAVQQLDRPGLERLLRDHQQRLGTLVLGREIILPLGEVIGDLWALGRLGIAAEHLASEVVVPLLKAELGSPLSQGPILLAACVPGERHEWGMLVSLLEVRSRGWQVRYLGPDLPFQDLVDAAWSVGPRAVALSASNPGHLQTQLVELRRLPRLLPPRTPLVLGGQGVRGHGARLRRAGIQVGLEGVPAAAAVAVDAGLPRNRRA
jgi:DNA-binding transcriptional MerR regulator